MNTMKIKTLTIDRVINTIDVDQLTTINDPARLVPNASVTPIAITEYSTQPVEVHTYDWASTLGTQHIKFTDNRQSTSTTVSGNVVYLSYPYYFDDMISTYRYYRFDIEYTIVVHSSYNQTGLLGVYWRHSKGDDKSSTIPFIDDYKATSYWNQPSCRKTEIAFGRNSVTKIVVPWISESPYFANGYTISNYQNYANIFTNNVQPTLVIEPLVPIASISGAVQSADVKVYMTPINVRVGGYTGAAYFRKK